MIQPGALQNRAQLASMEESSRTYIQMLKAVFNGCGIVTMSFLNIFAKENIESVRSTKKSLLILKLFLYIKFGSFQWMSNVVDSSESS